MYLFKSILGVLRWQHVDASVYCKNDSFYSVFVSIVYPVNRCFCVAKKE